MIRSLMFTGLLLAGAAQAAEPAPSTSSVTIYSRDLAFVHESRVLDFGAGRDTARLVGIPERIDFSSVRLEPAGRARVRRLALEVSSGGDLLIEQARGRRVRVSLRGARVVEGTLVAADGGWLVVRGDDAALETLSRAAVDEIRTPDPAPYRLEPALSVVLDAAPAGRVAVELSYLTGGLSWSAEHTLVRAGEKTALWTSRVTVENASGHSFEVPKLALVAGEPNRAGGMPMPASRGVEYLASAVATKADLSQEAFSEYHLYTLDRPARLDDRETQMFTMLEPRAVQVTPRYLARSGAGVVAQLELENKGASGLGVPIPAGRVRIYERDANGIQRFSGESAVRHTPEGERMTLDLGTAFDLVAERREVANRMISERERESQVEVKLKNRKAAPVTIQVEESVASDHEVVRSSHPATSKDANTLQFSIPVPAGKEVVLTYTVRQRF